MNSEPVGCPVWAVCVARSNARRQVSQKQQHRKVCNECVLPGSRLQAEPRNVCAHGHVCGCYCLSVIVTHECEYKHKHAVDGSVDKPKLGRVSMFCLGGCAPAFVILSQCTWGYCVCGACFARGSCVVFVQASVTHMGMPAWRLLRAAFCRLTHPYQVLPTLLAGPLRCKQPTWTDTCRQTSLQLLQSVQQPLILRQD